MAAPLFVATEDALKSALRLSAVPDSALDTQAIIDEAILRARLRFYTDLGADRTNELAALSFTDQPTTLDQVLRGVCNTTEVKLVYCALLRLLPNTFMDASGDRNARWNEEAPTRERGGFELEDELRRCENEVVEAMLQLADPNTPQCDEVQVFDGTPDRQTSFPENTPRVGQTLRGPSGVNPPAED